MAETETTDAPSQRDAEKAIFDSITQGSASSQPEQNTEVQPTQSLEADQPEGQAAPEESAPSLPEDFEQRLRWDNWDPEAIEAVKGTLPHERLIAMYGDIEKRQTRIDRLYHERNQQARAKPEAVKEEEKPKPPSLKDALGDKADLLGDDVVAILESHLDERLKQIAPVQQPVQEQPAQADLEREQAVAAEVEANRVRLTDMYPSVRLAGAQWDDIVSKADVESRNPYYHESFTDHGEALQAVFDTVMAREYGHGQPLRNGRETTTSSGPVTRNSAAASPTTRSAPEELSKADQARLIWEHLQRNPNDVDGARRAAGLEPLNLHPRQIDRPNRR